MYNNILCIPNHCYNLQLLVSVTKSFKNDDYNVDCIYDIGFNASVDQGRCNQPILNLLAAATLTIADVGRPIVLRTKYILLQRNGGLRIGSETRPYMSPLEIILYSRSDDAHVHPIFGRKFIGVHSTAYIDIHGPWKQSWTFLTSSLRPGILYSVQCTQAYTVRQKVDHQVFIITLSNFGQFSEFFRWRIQQEICNTTIMNCKLPITTACDSEIISKIAVIFDEVMRKNLAIYFF